jgi:peptide chain release factor 1
MALILRQSRWLFSPTSASLFQPLSVRCATVGNPVIHLQSSRGVFSSSVQSLVDASVKRHEEIMEEMRKSGYTPANLAKELSSLTAIVELHRSRLALMEEQASIHYLRKESQESGDTDLDSECAAELARIESERATLEHRIVDAVIPRDDEDFESDAIIEIRAGTGGDEAALFAFELWDCYIKTAKSLRWKVDVLTESKTDLGGLKEGSLVVSGSASVQLAESGPWLGPYGVFKFESGVHRVQRVPVNDTRIHTSACSIAVLPSLEQDGNDQDLLPMTELKIETMRAHGAGGQHINTTDSAVRITHLPTGIQAAIQDERSQHKNKAKALKLIAARVRDVRRAEETAKLGAARSSLMGGGDRSERIRTFNFPQDRATDHRCKESNHGISVLLNGDRDDGLVMTFLPFLRAMRREELLRQLDGGRN